MTMLHITTLALFLGFGVFGMAVVLESWNKVMGNVRNEKQKVKTAPTPCPQTKVVSIAA